MSRRQRRKKVDRFARLKIAAIPLLLVVLVVVLVPTGGDEDTPPPPPPSASVATTGLAAPNESLPAVEDAGEQVEMQRLASHWDDDIPSVLNGPNPFADLRYQRIEPELLVSSDEAKSTESEPSLYEISERLREQPVRFRFQSANQNSIMVGDQLFRKGDRVTEGVHVDRITKGRLILKVHPGGNGSRTSTVN